MKRPDVMQGVELALFDTDANIRLTNDGYLVAAPRVARTGIQLYAGDEVGAPDMPIVRVYRPEEEVFNKDAMASLAFKPITNDHPSDGVTAKNWKQHSVGQASGDVARDGDCIRVPLCVMDGKTVRDVQTGKTQLSVGYQAALVWGKGVIPDGQPGAGQQYDAKQTNIRANHIAIVDRARGGPRLNIGDNQGRGVRNMAGENSVYRTITVDGIACEMTDTAAQIVQRQIEKMTNDMATAKTAHDAAIKATNDQVATLTTELATAKTALSTKDAEIVTLKKQVEDGKLKPEQLDALVRERGNVAAKAKAVLGDKVMIDGKTDAEIRRQVVDANLGDAAKGWSDEMVTASFNTLTKDAKIDGAQPTGGTPILPAGGGNTLVDLARAFSGKPPANGNPGEAAYSEYTKSLGDAWKGDQHKAN